MLRFTHTRRMLQGFSLVEMSIVLVIMSIVLTGGLLGAANFAQHQAYIDTEKKIDKIHKAIQHYHSRQGAIPCPARLNVSLNHEDFGIATGVQTPIVATAIATVCTPGAQPSGTFRVASNGQAVRIGALPTRAFGMADDMAADAFGNRFIYAVTEAHTDASEFSATTGLGDTEAASNPGIITIYGTNDLAASDVSYALISLGENGRKRGAYRHKTGIQVASCTGAGQDVENCDNGNESFREVLFNKGNQAANYYDDIIRYGQRFMLGAFGLGNISTECNRTNTGIVRYNSIELKREYCNGSTWDDIPDSTGDTGLAVACFAFEEGMVRVNPDTIGTTNTLQECDGAVWNDLF